MGGSNFFHQNFGTGPGAGSLHLWVRVIARFSCDRACRVRQMFIIYTFIKQLFYLIAVSSVLSTRPSFLLGFRHQAATYTSFIKRDHIQSLLNQFLVVPFQIRSKILQCLLFVLKFSAQINLKKVLSPNHFSIHFKFFL